MKVESIGKQSGFSVLEAMLALAILVTAFSAVILIAFGNEKVALDNQVGGEAISMANRLLEEARGQAGLDFNALNYPSGSQDIYRKELMVTDINSCKKSGIASISWTVESGRPQKLEFQTMFTDLGAAVGLSGDCGPEQPVTGWSDLVCGDNEASFDFPTASISATGLDVISRDSVKYAVIGANGPGGQDDFWIVDMASKASLNKISSLDAGPGLNDIDVASNFVFAANNATSKQLQVIDINDLSNPAVVASVSLKGSALNNSEGRRVFYYNDRAYIGTNYTGINGRDEFQIFDVSNPLNPIFAGSYNVNHNVYDIIVRNQIILGANRTVAYLALSAGTDDKPELIVLDVTNPSSITQIGLFNPLGKNQYATDIYILGNKLYLGREKGTKSDFIVLDVSNPSSIATVSSNLLGLKSGKETRSIVVSSGLAMVSTSDNIRDGFQVWNVADGIIPSRISRCDYLQEAVDMEFDGNYVYIAGKGQKALRIIYDASNPYE